MIRIGVVAEGRPDQAVISNIVSFFFKEKEYDLVLIRPDLNFDATDRKLKDKAAAGGLSRIKKDCEEKTLFEQFFALDFLDIDKIIIQVDTAEIEEFGITRPNKEDNRYSKILRKNVINKIKKDWLDGKYSDKLLFAVAIEELEAWILTLYKNEDSTKYLNPKKILKRELSRRNINSKEDYSNYELITKDFRKKRTILTSLERNESFSFFCWELFFLALEI